MNFIKKSDLRFRAGGLFSHRKFYVVTMCFYKKKIGDLIVHLLAEVPRRLILRM